MNYDYYRGLWPDIYNGVVEIDEIAKSSYQVLQLAENAMTQAFDDQFIATASEAAIEEYEKTYGIIADSANETLDFRRERIRSRLSTYPPFTMIFLRNRLDQIIGEGEYTAYVDYSTRTLYLELTQSDVNWYQELLVFINAIKPANMIFSLSPLEFNRVGMYESVDYNHLVWNYRLNGSWALGAKPFAEFTEWEDIKLPNTRSITQAMIEAHAQFTMDNVTQVRLNGTLVIPVGGKSLETEIVNGQTEWVTVLTTTFTFADLGADVNRYETLLADGTVWTDAAVYAPVPADGNITMRHRINHRECLMNT